MNSKTLEIAVSEKLEMGKGSSKELSSSIRSSSICFRKVALNAIFLSTLIILKSFETIVMSIDPLLPDAAADITFPPFFSIVDL